MAFKTGHRIIRFRSGNIQPKVVLGGRLSDSRGHLFQVLVAAASVLVIGISLLMTAVGLSPALGTFIAGVVLADSEYRHELESDIEPVILDHNETNVDVLRRLGFEIYYGDVTRLDLLESAGAAEAELLIITLGNHEKGIVLDVDGTVFQRF